MAVSLDLSGLDNPAPSSASGDPMTLALDVIDLDPNQPRKTFDADAMADFVLSIKEQGILQPISVRPNPEKPGRWIINMGERRYRGAVAAGLTDIPAFVSKTIDGYSQVIENLQREELTAIDLARFIEEKKAEGEKNADIARKLGKDRSFVTNHLALIDPPEAIAEAINAGRLTTAKYVYDLRGLHDKFPEQVAEWLATAGDITRSGISALSKSLKVLDGSNKLPPDPEKPAAVVLDGSNTTAGEGDGVGGDKTPGKTNSAQNSDEGIGAGGAGGAGEGGSTTFTSWPPGKVGVDPDLIKKPLFLVKVGDRSAAVLLNRRPSDSGRLRVRYEDNGADEEVAAVDCTPLLLIEQPK